MLPPIEIDPKTFLRQHCTLPALPAVVGQIQNLIHDYNVDMEKVAELISSDPAILAQVLKIVNSAYYGLPREIGDVRFAIAFLGLNEIYRMVLSLSAILTPWLLTRKTSSMSSGFIPSIQPFAPSTWPRSTSLTCPLRNYGQQPCFMTSANWSI